MKSQPLKRFHKSLSYLNNAFTHYFFVWTQFNTDYSNPISKGKKELTVDFFKENPFSPKHRIRLNLLPVEHEKANETLLHGIFILILSHFEEYLKEAHGFARKIDEAIVALDQGTFENDDLIIEKVLNRVGIAKASLSPEFLDSYDYLRFKRNRLIHKSSENISRTIRGLINNKGKGLNDFWDNQLPKGRQGIDFTNKEAVDNLEFDTLIDLLNMLRGISDAIDQVIIQKLGADNILQKEIIPTFMEERKLKPKRLAEKRILKNLEGYCKSVYNYATDATHLKNVLDDIA
jgi:predicted ThiF/HesA family dinucleotide-utilizing enzyme